MAAAAGGPVTALGLRNALGLAEAGIAIMDNQIITGEGKERGGDKRSVDRLIQSNLDSREETAMLGEFCIWGHRGAAVVDCRHH